MTNPTTPRRGHLRTVEWTKVSHGLFRPRSDDDTGGRGVGSPAWRADPSAWRLVLPSSGAFTHLTACALYGWWLPPVPADLPVFACVGPDEFRPRRGGIIVSRYVTERRPVMRAGLPVDRAVEVLARAARDLHVLDMVVLIDSALHNGDCSRDELHSACAESADGVRTLRRAVELSDARSESPWESVLRVFHALRGAGRAQFEVYDGAVHRERRAHRQDLSRDRRLLTAHVERRGFTSIDLMGRAHMILREADDALGRPHDPRRLKIWYSTLRESLFSPGGTARLRKKWRLPVHGLAHCSKSA